MKKKDLLRQLKDEKVVEIVMAAPVMRGNTTPLMKISKKQVRDSLKDLGDEDFTGWKLFYNFPVVGQYQLIGDWNEGYEEE